MDNFTPRDPEVLPPVLHGDVLPEAAEQVSAVIKTAIGEPADKVPVGQLEAGMFVD